MNSTRQESLEETFITVLEQFAFMFADLVEKEELPPSEPDYASVNLSFTGEFSGSLTIAVPASACVIFSANILGTDPGNPVAQDGAQDAMQELANVCCGHILTSIAGEEPVFDLGSPNYQYMNLQEWNKLLHHPETLAFEVDECPLLLQWIDNALDR